MAPHRQSAKEVGRNALPLDSDEDVSPVALREGTDVDTRDDAVGSFGFPRQVFRKTDNY
ncbi:hypothetical protein LTR28_003389, partial [Elasticomyces elasticus]